MPHYFFHLRSPGPNVTDPEGAELPDIASAHAVALDTIRKLLSDPQDGADYSTWSIEIIDETGQTVLQVPFQPKLDS